MISVEEALKALEDNRPDWGTVELPLDQINGLELAQDIIAPFNHPKSSVSVMDGYAFRTDDADKPLDLIGESRAGVPYDGELGAGEAVRIFTGALLPKGADQVEMQENAVLNGQTVSFSSLSTHRNFVRKAGSDFSKGACLYPKGRRVTPEMILGIATCNFAALTVKRKPTVALLSSGDELRSAGSMLSDATIINSINPALAALLTQWGVIVQDLGIATDNENDINDRIANCDADIIVPIGGASVGNYDLMQPIAKSLGFDPVFSKVAVKPGKPTWFSKRGDQCILGLPGNPSSAWVCAQVFLKPFILGRQPLKTAILDQSISKNGPRETYLRGKYLANGHVAPLSRQDSGLVTPLGDADILIRVPAYSNRLNKGDKATIVKFGQHFQSSNS